MQYSTGDKLAFHVYTDCVFVMIIQLAIIGLGNGIMSNRQQTFTWTIDYPDHWHINLSQPMLI